MGTLLEALMSESTVEKTLESSAKEIKRIGNSSDQRGFGVTAKDGFIVTKLYPNSMYNEPITSKSKSKSKSKSD